MSPSNSCGLSLIGALLYLVLALTKLLFMHTGEKASTEYLVACGLAKRNLSSQPSSNHLLTLDKKQKFMVSFKTNTLWR